MDDKYVYDWYTDRYVSYTLKGGQWVTLFFNIGLCKENALPSHLKRPGYNYSLRLHCLNINMIGI